MVAVGVVVSRGFVNGVQILSRAAAPAPGPSLGSRRFPLAVHLASILLGVTLGRFLVVGVVLGGHR